MDQGCFNAFHGIPGISETISGILGGFQGKFQRISKASQRRLRSGFRISGGFQVSIGKCQRDFKASHETIMGDKKMFQGISQSFVRISEWVLGVQAAFIGDLGLFRRLSRELQGRFRGFQGVSGILKEVFGGV